ncbi:c-type cytochrome [Desulfuromonas versatilis]|uniref:C-type cytochrome n=1 Tax=Desulfuromonas versatilis TaxID=2802975 RepID=A0ABM8HYI5_9BACT|nr:cytochrome P460 family protein [Desulfuromonas versatilis]BCR05657.1 c-type cytochrome [Desulfuromonas versatilis]
MRRLWWGGFLVLVLMASGERAGAVDLKETMKGILDAAAGFSPYVDAQGAISLPLGVRGEWVHLGSWVVPDEKAPGYGFHDVYTQPESVAAFRKNGVFPDGAVLVKEIRTVKTDDLTTGRASWAGEPAVWFVMVKDGKNRFAGNPLWGEGWGWALFKAEDPKKNVATSFQKDCMACHIPAKETDWVYLQGYPSLQ